MTFLALEFETINGFSELTSSRPSSSASSSIKTSSVLIGSSKLGGNDDDDDDDDGWELVVFEAVWLLTENGRIVDDDEEFGTWKIVHQLLSNPLLWSVSFDSIKLTTIQLVDDHWTLISELVPIWWRFREFDVRIFRLLWIFLSIQIWMELNRFFPLSTDMKISLCTSSSSEKESNLFVVSVTRKVTCSTSVY